VVTTNSISYGLIVDALLNPEEVVIKSLGRHLQQCQGYAGATIMGDGRTAMILDVSDLAQMARLASIDDKRITEENVQVAGEPGQCEKEILRLLLFHCAEDEQFAVPLDQVERIEKIPRSAIQVLGGRRIMQYREGILALVAIDDISKAHPLADDDELLVLVFTIGTQVIGLLATNPVDAAEISADLDGSTLKQPGILGSFIIDDRTTMLVDILEIAQTLFPDRFPRRLLCSPDTCDDTSALADSPTILVVEDSNFSRSQVGGYSLNPDFGSWKHQPLPIGVTGSGCSE
jgi:two-component system chemotaxis sensor kinase CheA